MKTVNSLSGGMTSSFMAVHFPADIEIFSIVRIDDPRCAPKDIGLIREVRKKIGCAFIATAEDDQTLRVMLDLEQMIGREIVWQYGDSFDDLIKGKKMLPNSLTRFCTSKMKIEPIFLYMSWVLGNTWKYYGHPDREWEKAKMRIGFRADEIDRKEGFKTDYKYAFEKWESGRHKGKNKYTNFDWREPEFPLIDNRIYHYQVVKFWKDHPQIVFPKMSNCVGCFFKHPQYLKKQFLDPANTAKMQWFARQEELLSKKLGKRVTFRKDYSYRQIEKMNFTEDIDFTNWTMCNSGHCTD